MVLKSFVSGLLGILLFLNTASYAAQDQNAPPEQNHLGRKVRVSKPKVGESIKHDLSLPLSLIPAKPIVQPENVEIPNILLPNKGEIYDGPSPDPVIQNSPFSTDIAVSPAIPPTTLNFDGINNVNGVLPPDTNGDVGPNHYFQIVNLSFAVYNKNGTIALTPRNTNTIWSGFGGLCETTNRGDPIVLYDQLAGRWLVSQFAFTSTSTPPYYQCIAISQSTDPTGAYYRYAFLISNTHLNDYPKFGVWPDGYYMSINQFPSGQPPVSAGAVVFERDKMISGQTARFVKFDVTNDFGQLPSDLDGSSLPPAGSPNYFADFEPNAFHLWKFHVDWNNVANSTFSEASLLSVAPFDSSFACSGRACIPQQGTTQRVDVLSDRLMYRLAYRNFGTYESLVTNHTVDVDTNHAGVRWYEVRSPNTSPVLYQQGTYAPDANHRWMGSIGMDSSGNMALGYSVSSSNLYPSIRYTGRLTNDPLGTLPQGEGSIIAGGGSQTSTLARWGDYSSMSIDPVDNCTFWYTTEYYSSTSPSNWRTRIGSFKFPSCVTPVDGATFVSQLGPPVSMTPGQSVSVSITMKNTGTTTWTVAAGYKLGSQNPQDNLNWGLGRVALPSSVAPNTQITFTFNITAPSTPGNYNFQWRMLREGVAWFGDYTPNVVVAVTAAQPPYPPGARAIPGLIEAEHFDQGGEGVAYHDNEAANLGGQFRTSEGVDITTTGDVGGGYIVGWIVPGEWLEYTVNVPTAGAYTLEARVAAFNYGGSFHVEFNQVNVTLGGIPIPNTGGWDTWVTVRKNVTLSAGNNQIMRIAMDTPGYYGYVGNINKVRLAQYQGYLDAADCQFIYGWAWDKGQPNTPINVDIYSDGAFLTTYPANAFRQDLLDAGIGNGYHAFAFPVPASLKNGQPHSIAVKYSGTIDSLIGSPRTITCGGASISIVWILPAEETWGPPGSLTAAGYALNGSGGVQLVWRDATINGPWNVVAYQATPSPVDGSWSNTIPAPTDRCHIYQAYANYSGVTSSTFTYNGVAQGDCTIQVVSGTYGGNCGAPTGNATWHLAPTCNGQTNCNYTVSVYTLGDPVPGCAKDYVARWTCGGGSTIKIATVPPEAGWGSVVNLICP